MNDKHVLVTGGAGFIGSHSVEALLATGARVTVLDNFSSGKRRNLPEHSALKVVNGIFATSKLSTRR
jgi:UDP-glucose 4-epimerase